MLNTKISDEELLKKLTDEKGRIFWSELKRFFASGLTVGVSGDLDLVEVAFDFTKDNRDKVERFMGEGKVAKVTDDQAQAWFASETPVWSIVVAPWVLVQKI